MSIKTRYGNNVVYIAAKLTPRRTLEGVYPRLMPIFVHALNPRHLPENTPPNARTPVPYANGVVETGPNAAACPSPQLIHPCDARVSPLRSLTLHLRSPLIYPRRHPTALVVDLPRLRCGLWLSGLILAGGLGFLEGLGFPRYSISNRPLQDALLYILATPQPLEAVRTVPACLPARIKGVDMGLGRRRELI